MDEEFIVHAAKLASLLASIYPCNVQGLVPHVRIWMLLFRNELNMISVKCSSTYFLRIYACLQMTSNQFLFFK